MKSRGRQIHSQNAAANEDPRQEENSKALSA